jgi:putative endonuclease
VVTGLSRLRALARGRQAEDLAAQEVRRAGLQILARNARFKGGELDLVALDGEQLVIIEVRARAVSRFGTAADSVTAVKQARLARATQAWLQLHPMHQHRAIRFDVLTFDGDAAPRWIRHAFEVAG